MAAIVDIREFNGASPGTPTTKTSGTIRFKDADDANVDLINPIVRPGGGSVFSYEKWLRLRIGATGPTGSITSPRAFSDGADGLGTGVTMKAGQNGAGTTPFGYTQPVKTNSTVATTDFFSFSSGAPLALNQDVAGPFSGTNADIADFLVLQVQVASTSSPGLTPTETLSLAYDET